MGTGTLMGNFAARGLSRKLLTPALAALLALASLPCLAAEEPDAPRDGPKGAAVTVLKATKSCFSAIVEVSGIVMPREETAVRPERPAGSPPGLTMPDTSGSGEHTAGIHSHLNLL